MKTTQKDIEPLGTMLKTLLRKTERLGEQLDKIQHYLEVKDRSPWMTVEDAANYCGYARSSFYNRYKDEIPHHQRDTRIMFHLDDVDAWMKKNVKTPESW